MGLKLSDDLAQASDAILCADIPHGLGNKPNIHLSFVGDLAVGRLQQHWGYLPDGEARRRCTEKSFDKNKTTIHIREYYLYYSLIWNKRI